MAQGWSQRDEAMDGRPEKRPFPLMKVICSLVPLEKSENFKPEEYKTIFNCFYLY